MDFKKNVMNLLHNSAKFTGEWEARVYSIGESILFEDTRNGIDPVVLDRIFDPFVSADASKNRLSSGLGIGLSIAKNLAMNYGYDLRIDKNVSNGSRLILSKYENLTSL